MLRYALDSVLSSLVSTSPKGLPQVCFPSSTFLANLAPVCTNPSTIPATVNTPPMMAHVVVMKWYL